MSITTFSNRGFNQNTSGAKRSASREPVLIADRDRPANVLPILERQQCLATSPHGILYLLGMSAEIEFEPPKACALSRQPSVSYCTGWARMWFPTFLNSESAKLMPR